MSGSHGLQLCAEWGWIQKASLLEYVNGQQGITGACITRRLWNCVEIKSGEGSWALKDSC